MAGILLGWVCWRVNHSITISFHLSQFHAISLTIKPRKTRREENWFMMTHSWFNLFFINFSIRNWRSSIREQVKRALYNAIHHWSVDINAPLIGHRLLLVIITTDMMYELFQNRCYLDFHLFTCWIDALNLFILPHLPTGRSRSTKFQFLSLGSFQFYSCFLPKMI